MAEQLLHNPAQRRRSRYIFFFQLPWIPEWVLTRNGAAQVARALRGGSAVREAWPPEETDHYRRAFLQPGAARAALGYYRAACRGWGSLRRDGRARPIAAPTLIVWGALDRFLGRETVDPEAMEPYFAPGNAPAIRFLEEAGHFVQNEAPERVNAAMLEWLGAPAPATGGST